MRHKIPDFVKGFAEDNKKAEKLGVSYGQYKNLQFTGMIDKKGNFTQKGIEFGYAARYSK